MFHCSMSLMFLHSVFRMFNVHAVKFACGMCKCATHAIQITENVKKKIVLLLWLRITLFMHLMDTDRQTVSFLCLPFFPLSLCVSPSPTSVSFFVFFTFAISSVKLFILSLTRKSALQPKLYNAYMDSAHKCQKKKMYEKWIEIERKCWWGIFCFQSCFQSFVLPFLTYFTISFYYFMFKSEMHEHTLRIQWID